MTRLYFEDLSVGSTWELGAYEMTQEEIVEFATQYDPQPFHVDPVAAEDEFFGELIASGWHTACVYIRLLTVDFLDSTSHLVGKRVFDLRWLRPVRPGDELTGSVEITGTSTSESRRDRGYVDYRIVGTNQAEDDVFRMDLHGIFERRTLADEA